MENNPAFLQVKDKKNLVASRLYQEGFSTGLLKKLAQELQVSLRTIRRWAKAVNGNNVESDNKRVKKPNSLEITAHSLKLCDFGLCTYLALLMSKILRKK
ncbi:MAG: helix-turn-helix domain-containing protein [Succinivibrionaceae bacterium]|nr:helix-turn-helix domain-containing protein [Succinivibrionaceae bacterium]